MTISLHILAAYLLIGFGVVLDHALDDLDRGTDFTPWQYAGLVLLAFLLWPLGVILAVMHWMKDRRDRIAASRLHGCAD